MSQQYRASPEFTVIHDTSSIVSIDSTSTESTGTSTPEQTQPLSTAFQTGSFVKKSHIRSYQTSARSEIRLHKGSGSGTTTRGPDVVAYLLDAAVLLVKAKAKWVRGYEQYEVYKEPIPLLQLSISSSPVSDRPSLSRALSRMILHGKSSLEDKQTLLLTRLGTNGFTKTFFATSTTQLAEFLAAIKQRQKELVARFDRHFSKTVIIPAVRDRIQCLLPVERKGKILYGTASGLYILDRGSTSELSRQVLDTKHVKQIERFGDGGYLVLANRRLLLYTADSIIKENNEKGAQSQPKGHLVHNGAVDFYKSGIGLGRELVCAVKTSPLSTTIYVYKTDKPGFAGKVQHNTILFRKYNIPTEAYSVHFLRSTLCIGCARGFEVLSLETADLVSQSLLDQADTSLDFAQRAKILITPIDMQRLNGEFLLNYREFSFFVNRNGWRSRPDFLIRWEGAPVSFVLQYPYIIAFGSRLIEVAHVVKGKMEWVTVGKDIRMVFSSPGEVLIVQEDDAGHDVVIRLDMFLIPTS
ncbi:CNH domain-containing protein [Aspergillus keveii]|uniref:CNH domain-containing protein n=1 Tax=Aspergillus keveii TaxID=714993 RepID=A0ABR4FS58_9EURO